MIFEYTFFADVSSRIDPDFAPDPGSPVPAYAFHPHPAARGTRDGRDDVERVCVDQRLVECRRGLLAQRTAADRVAHRPQMTCKSMAALVLAFFLILTIVSFLRRDLRPWLGLGAFWAIGFVLIVLNVFGLGNVLWTNGRYSLTLERLAPTWAMLGWLLFMVGSVLTVRSAYAHSRQPLLRNRLNYWTPVFLLLALNDVLILGGIPLPGNPIRLAAVALGDVYRRHA